MQTISVSGVNALYDFAAANRGDSIELDCTSWDTCSNELKAVFDHPDEPVAAFILFAGLKVYRPFGAETPSWMRKK